MDESREILSDDKTNSTETSKIMVECIPAEFVVRLIASKFLLVGVPKTLINDERVRVSLKNSSLSILTSCVELDSNLFFIKLPSNYILDDDLPKQSISDVIYYAFHEDPLVRANVIMLVGKFIKSVLSLNIKYEKILEICGDQKIFRIMNLLRILMKGLMDKNYIVVKHALSTFEEIINHLILFPGDSEEGCGTSDINDSRLNVKNKLLLLDSIFSLFHFDNFWMVHLKFCDVIVGIDYEQLELIIGKEKRKFYEVSSIAFKSFM
jgi:hypothetical protein